MAASGFTPIQLYRSATPGAVPTAANLAPGELALNTADQKLFFENASGVVVSIDTANGTVTSVNASGGTTGLTFSGGPITTSGTLTLAGTLAVANGGTGVTTSTGTTSVVLSNSPVLVTPTLGAASATSIANGLGAVGTPSYTFTGDLNTGMWSPAADTIAFSEGGVEAMRIDSSGQVGIGTSTPTGKLEVSQATTSTAAIQITSTSGTNPYQAFTDPFGTSAIAGGGGTLFLRAGGAGAGDNKVYVLSSGNVGIGAASPSERLSVNGNIRLPDSNNIYWGGTANYVTGSNASNFLALGTNSSERMRIDSSGNVGIGTSSPGYKLDVNGTGYFNSSVQFFPQDGFRFTSVSAVSAMRFGSAAVGESTAEWAYNRVTAATTLSVGNTGSALTERMRIDSSGNVGIGTSSPDANAKLDVAGTVRSGVGASDPGTGAAFYLVGSGSFQTVIGGAAFAVNTGANNARTERMRIDASGNVGIGTSSPGARLNVVGTNEFVLGLLAQTTSTQTPITNHPVALFYNSSTAAGNGVGLRYQLADTTGNAQTAGGVGVVATAKTSSTVTTDMYFYLGTSERMRITSAGNVGIGTTSPATMLDVNGSVTANQNFFAATGGVWFNAANTFTRGMAQAGSDVNFFTSSTERMRIDSSGNVGIGTSSPGAKLDVSSSTFNIVASRSTGGYAAFQRFAPSGQTAYDFYTINGVEAARIAVDGSNIMSFATGSAATERMRIDSSGNVGIGTSSPSSFARLAVVSSAFNGFYVDAQGVASNAIFDKNNTAGGYLIFNYSGAGVGSITTNGTTTSYNITSDARLKENIAPADDAAALIDAIEVRKFDWKSNGSHQRYGFIAQELVEVAPEAVHVPEDEEQMMAVDYSKLVPMLIKEIQSLRARVAQLEATTSTIKFEGD